MTPERIREIADHPETPSFLFGGEQLDAWTRAHINRHTGECVRSSSHYVVIHPSLAPDLRPTFRVLSIWINGQHFPCSWDIDDTLPEMPHSV